MSTMTFLTQQQEVAARLRLSLSEDDKATLVKRWLNQSQQEIWAAHDWPWALDREPVQTVADYTTGTVSVGASSQAVVGSGTAFASSHVGSFIQFSSSDDWYKITAVADATDLTIEAPYVGTSSLSGGTFTIRKMFYSLSSSVEKVLGISQATSPRRLTMVPHQLLGRLRPFSDATGSPILYAPWGYDSSNRWTFALEPHPDEVLNLEVQFKKKATDMSADSDVSVIPEKWHQTVLIDGALYRGLEYVQTDAGDMRAERKRAQFRAGIEAMIADAMPTSDYHPIIANRDVRMSPSGLRLPDDFDTRRA